MCNKLASRHVRVRLADPRDVPRCDICENAPAFFYCEIDGSSLYLHYDMIVHVGGDKPSCLDKLGLQPGVLVEIRWEQNQLPTMRENQQNHRVSAVPVLDTNTDGGGKMDYKMFDLNAKSQRVHGQASNNQVEVFPLFIFFSVLDSDYIV
ncbi:hypothetical protein U1Q18_036689 [Sarracenia purpurea var. burkii]